MGSGGRTNSSRSSSGEEDGDADWKAAIDSVATATSIRRLTADVIACNSKGSTTKLLGRAIQYDENGEVANHNHQNLKHYHIKAQKLLYDIVEKTIEIVKEEDPIQVLDVDPMINDGGVRLFKHAPHGIVFDHIDELQRPTKKPRILPGKEIDENSKKFRWQVQSIAVDGMDIISAARESHQKTLALREAKDAAVKAAKKREEGRVTELRKTRGERWLPSIARNMQSLKAQSIFNRV